MESEVKILEDGTIESKLSFTVQQWEESSLLFMEHFPNSQVHTDSDGSARIDLALTSDEFNSALEAMPAPDTDSSPQLAGFWPKPHWYCVKVWTRKGGRRLLCQKSIYESPLWAWARAAGIGLRMAGKSADVNMSSGRCTGDQNSCGI